MAQSPPPSLRRIRVTSQGRLLFLAGATWAVIGLLAQQPLASLFGAFVIAVMGSLYATASLLQARLQAGKKNVISVLGEGALPEETQTAVQLGSQRVRVGESLKLRFQLRLALPLSARGLLITPLAAGSLEAKLGANESEHAILTLTPRRVGDNFLQGFRVEARTAGGLFQLSCWVPHRIRIEALPRHFQGRTLQGLRSTRAAIQAQIGSRVARRRGFGLELRQLRDHQSGDPLKHIAWRATARRGKLTSREFESDLVLSTWVAVDVSPSMFWGEPGKSRIDYAIDTAYGLLSVVNTTGHKAGLIVFDSEVRLVVSPASGRAQMVRLTEAILEISSLVHYGRTEISDRELTGLIANWFKSQERIDFNLSHGHLGEHSNLDIARLVSRTRARLHEYLASERGGRSVISPDDYAADSHQSMFRAFARHAGIPLPLDPTPIPDGQAHGLASMFHEVLTSRSGPNSILIISDLHTATDLDLIRRSALAARRRRHSVIVFCPSDPAFDALPATQRESLENALLDTARLQVEQRLRVTRSVLHPAGVSFLHCGPQDVVGRLLERLRRAS